MNKKLKRSRSGSNKKLKRSISRSNKKLKRSRSGSNKKLKRSRSGSNKKLKRSRSRNRSGSNKKLKRSRSRSRIHKKNEIVKEPSKKKVSKRLSKKTKKLVNKDYGDRDEDKKGIEKMKILKKGEKGEEESKKGEKGEEESKKGEKGDLMMCPNNKFGRTNEIIGKGSFKTVYKAFNTKNGAEVAWAFIDPKKIAKRKDKENIIDEVYLLRKVFSDNIHITPHIIRFIDSWYVSGVQEIVIITELYKDGTLSRHFQTYKDYITINHIKRWCYQILEGLLFLHSNNIIHRDLKLDNILFDSSSSNIYLADFGISVNFELEKEKEKEKKLKKNKVSDDPVKALVDNDPVKALVYNDPVGTPVYMAPEIFSCDEGYDISVDMYAFGICLLEMLTKEEAYSECNGSIGKIYYYKINNILPLSIEKIRDLELKNIVLKLLSIDKNERPTAYYLYNSNIFLSPS